MLVAEDDKTLLNVPKYNLLKEGYGVVTAFNDVQSLELAWTRWNSKLSRLYN